ncbi:cupin-like domain-containing protein [Oscillatoria acuminata]|uniref:Cupin superfamily protein n=1 Tax=Oscillatoria acuminata PCC 6304 TaxID=56110 RepID=K9TBH3_9CYAN|nr:cupin-like domain-containing protein [Oscillatoria acuminata]AFY79880.1 Cupin superfamily protein [Oscillatoria acuminata PCC 6304]
MNVDQLSGKMKTEKIEIEPAIATSEDSQLLQVMLLLEGGHQCEIALLPDAPLLRELFQGLTTAPESAESKLFQIPIEGGNAALYFPGESLVAIATDPPVAIESLDLEREEAEPDNPVQQLEWQLNIYRKLDKLSPNYGKIARIPHVSGAEFLERYYIGNKPVIFTDLMEKWPALYQWTPEYLKENYGHVTVGAQFNRNSNPAYEKQRRKHQKMLPLGEFVDIIRQGGETNDYYMGSYNGNLCRKPLQGLFNDIQLFPEYLTATPEPNRTVLWFGPAGAITPLHFDALNSFLCQVYGRKQVRLISPNHKHLLGNYGKYFSDIDLDHLDYERYPQLKEVDIIEVVLEAGEVLFLPVGWWHQVKSLDVSISISFMNFLVHNDFEE